MKQKKMLLFIEDLVGYFSHFFETASLSNPSLPSSSFSEISESYPYGLKREMENLYFVRTPSLTVANMNQYFKETQAVSHDRVNLILAIISAISQCGDQPRLLVLKVTPFFDVACAYFMTLSVPSDGSDNAEGHCAAPIFSDGLAQNPRCPLLLPLPLSLSSILTLFPIHISVFPHSMKRVLVRF
jgi:hypothetical protein